MVDGGWSRSELVWDRDNGMRRSCLDRRFPHAEYDHHPKPRCEVQRMGSLLGRPSSSALFIRMETREHESRMRACYTRQEG